MFRVLDMLTVKWATGDLPEECRFFLITQLHVLEERRRTHNKDRCSTLASGSDLWQKRRQSPLTFQRDQ